MSLIIELHFLKFVKFTNNKQKQTNWASFFYRLILQNFVFGHNITVVCVKSSFFAFLQRKSLSLKSMKIVIVRMGRTICF